MKKKLTNSVIGNLKPEASRYEIADSGCRNLVLTVFPTGLKSFALRIRLNGVPIKVTLGKLAERPQLLKAPKLGDDLSLADAHTLAAEVRHQVKQGIDPRQVRRDRRDEAQRAEADTFRSVCEQYMRDECGMEIRADGRASFDRAKKRSGPERWRILNRQILPVLGGRAIESITKADIRDLLDKLAQGKLRNDEDERIEGGEFAANRALSTVRAVLMWREERGDGDYRAPPFRGLTRTERPRERSLNESELKLVWRVAESAGLFGSFVRFVLLTACRRTEAAAMTRDEVVNEIVHGQKETVWTIPGARVKGGVDVVIPLSQAAIDILDALPVIDGCKFYFTIDGKGPITSYSRFKKEFDQAVLDELHRTNPQAQPLSLWRIHDLRRSARSLLSKAGVDPDTCERCLGHRLGGIRATYDRFDYYEPKRDAFAKLANLIQRITSPEEDNVVLLKKPGA
jgi:integrase